MDLNDGGKDLFRQENILKYSSHVEFLRRCLKEDLIPTGFRIKWRLTTDFYRDINEKCEKIKRDASLKLMEMTVESCQRKLEQLKSEEVTFETFESKYLNDFEENLRKAKNKKFNVLKHRRTKLQNRYKIRS